MRVKKCLFLNCEGDYPKREGDFFNCLHDAKKALSNLTTAIQMLYLCSVRFMNQYTQIISLLTI